MKKCADMINLSNSDCYSLRGIAILCIFIHNYCHLLPNAPQENEYSWSIERTHIFWSCLSNDLFVPLFSFWGHYGVPIFVFLSGYGLVQKYEKGSGIHLWKYIFSHYLKLIKLLLPGFLLYLLVSWLLYGNFDDINVVRFILQLLLINNFVPTMYLPITPGPYWYFGLTMQLYIIYLFLYKYIHRGMFLLVLCVLLLFYSVDHHNLTVWLKYNFWGSSIPFILGILFAKSYCLSKIHVNRIYWLLGVIFSFPLLLLVEQSFYSWVFSSLPVVCLSICIVKLSFHQLNMALSFIGTISQYIFVLHPVCRKMVFYMQETYSVNWQIGFVLYVLLTVFGSYVFLLSYRSINNLNLGLKFRK